MQFFRSKFYCFVFGATFGFCVRVYNFFSLISSTSVVCNILYPVFYFYICIFLCNMCIFLFKSFIFWTHFICYIVTAKILYDQIHFVFPRRSHFSIASSFWQDSNQYSIIFFQYCCYWYFAVVPCYVFTLRAGWICWCYLVCLNHLISPSIYALRMCLLGVLVGKFKYKVIWQAGLPATKKKIWCIASGGVLGKIVCVD